MTIGSWLPEPKSGPYRPNTPERTARMRTFGGLATWAVALMDACFTGLMLTEADLSLGGALFAGGLFAGGTGLALAAVLAAAWSDFP